MGWLAPVRNKGLSCIGASTRNTSTSQCLLCFFFVFGCGEFKTWTLAESYAFVKGHEMIDQPITCNAGCSSDTSYVL
jgi:hypothetical protein